MDSNLHPMRGIWHGTEVSAELEAVVKGIALPPQIAQPGKIEWAKDETSAPAGTYTDPSTQEAQDAIATVVASVKANRRAIAVALNFRTTADLDRARRAVGVMAVRANAAPKVVTYSADDVIALLTEAKASKSAIAKVTAVVTPVAATAAA